MDGAHGVFHGDPLVSGALGVLLGASEGGQDQRPAPGGQVRVVQFCGDLNAQPGVGQGLLGDVGIRGRPDEVAAHAHEEADFPVPHGADGCHGVIAVLTGRAELEFLVQPVVERLRHLFEDAHGAVALDVGVAAHRTNAGAGLADVALKQQDVDYVAEGGNGMLVLGQSHGPADDGGAGREHPLTCGMNLFQGEAGRLHNVVPLHLFQETQVVVKAHGVVVDEVVVQDR